MNDVREGKGTYKWKNGDEVTGLWRNNKLNGEVAFLSKGQNYNFHMIDGSITV
jgi:hypothetical protein